MICYFFTPNTTHNSKVQKKEDIIWQVLKKLQGSLVLKPQGSCFSFGPKLRRKNPTQNMSFTNLKFHSTQQSILRQESLQFFDFSCNFIFLFFTIPTLLVWSYKYLCMSSFFQLIILTKQFLFLITSPKFFFHKLSECLHHSAKPMRSNRLPAKIRF